MHVLQRTDRKNTFNISIPTDYKWLINLFPFANTFIAYAADLTGASRRIARDFTHCATVCCTQKKGRAGPGAGSGRARCGAAGPTPPPGPPPTTTTTPVTSPTFGASAPTFGASELSEPSERNGALLRNDGEATVRRNYTKRHLFIIYTYEEFMTRHDHIGWESKVEILRQRSCVHVERMSHFECNITSSSGHEFVALI